MRDEATIAARVEEASLADLRSFDIDDVYVQMEYVLRKRPTPLDLYRRWEKQNWLTQDLDFSEDRLQWANLSDGVFLGIRAELQRSFTLFFIGEQAVTDTLAPLVHAAPDEDTRIFLSTQLVDEARHTVFFSRFFDEVCGIAGGLHAVLVDLRDRVVADGYRRIFDTDLVAATDAVRIDPDDYGAWVEGIAVYHLVVEGMLALTGQKFLLGILREMQILPGFYAGFTAVARDESRHVNFGVRAIMEAGVRDRALLQRVEDVILRLLEPACMIIASPERKFVFRCEELAPNLQIDPYEVRDFSLYSLTKRLRVAGLSERLCEEIVVQGRRHFEVGWDLYEELHGEEHPRRFYDRMEPAVAT